MTNTATAPTTSGPKPLRETFRVNVQVAMARRSLNRVQLATALEVDPAWVTRRLNGSVKVDLDDLDRIAAALDTTPAELVTDGGAA